MRSGDVAVVGCRDAQVPTNLVWMRRTNDPQRAVVGCLWSDSTWLVECRDASWIGLDAAAANCSKTSPAGRKRARTERSN